MSLAEFQHYLHQFEQGAKLHVNGGAKDGSAVALPIITDAEGVHSIGRAIMHGNDVLRWFVSDTDGQGLYRFNPGRQGTCIGHVGTEQLAERWLIDPAAVIITV